MKRSIEQGNDRAEGGILSEGTGNRLAMWKPWQCLTTAWRLRSGFLIFSTWNGMAGPGVILIA